MKRRAGVRNRRKRVFVGCEGESERSYVGFLGGIAEERGLSIHFDTQICSGGDHLAVVETAVDRLRRRAQQHGQFWKRAIFLDSDRRGEHLERTTEADRIIAQHNLLPIWSDPCLEALLLRHFPGCERLRPPTSGQAHQELSRRWPDYKKPMTRLALRAKFEMADVQRAAGTSPDLLKFLSEIGFPDTPTTLN